MTITNPSLVLTYTDSGRTATITQADIIGHSIKLFKQLLNGLSPSSNRAELQLKKDCAETENIIACETDIKAVLENNGTAIFTGYLTTDYSWTVTENGEQALSLTLEDVGTRLLEKEFIHSGYHTFNSTVEVAVRAICATAGVTIATGTVFPQGNVIRAINSAVTCKAVLSELLAELNHVYYFNANGELCLFEVKCGSTSSLPTFDKNNLCSVNGKAISLSKKIRQYKNARVVYTETGSADNYTIYRNTTKDQATETDPCFLELTAGQHFDGTEKYTPQAGVTRTPAYIEAVNAMSEGSIVGSNEILVVASATPDIVATTSGLSATVNVAGGKYLSIDAKNEGSTAGHFTKLDVKGSIIYVKNTNIILTSNEEVATTQSDNIVEQELLWVHTKALAQKRANLLAQYHKYAGSVYTFYSTTHISAGTIARLHDDVKSGLDVNVLITRTTETDSSEIVEYGAVGISVFDLDRSVIESRINAGGYDNRQKGDKGDGTVVIIQYSKGTATRPYYGTVVGYAAGVGNNVVGSNATYVLGRSTWTDRQIDESTLDAGEYIWMRVGSYTPPQTESDIRDWRVYRLTGAQGDPATAWDFDMSSETYSIDRRSSSNNGAISLSANIQGISPVPTPSWSVKDKDNASLDSWLSATTGTSVTLTIPLNNTAVSPLTVTMSYTGKPSVVRTLTGVDKTYEPDGMYLGELSSIPSTPTEGDTFIAGDSFIASASFTGTDGNSYNIGVPYYYDGSDWHNTLDLSDSSNVGKAMECLGGVMKTGIAVPSSAALWGWFQNLVAQNAVIANLFSRNVMVGKGTGQAGSGFRFRAHAYDGNGNELANPVFDVYFDDKMLFSVNSSGHIFFGSGFWYDPTDEAIHSVGDGVVIDKYGFITATSGTFTNLSVDNTNGGYADFGSARFEFGATQSNLISLTASTQGKDLFDHICSTYGITVPASPGGYSGYYSCSVSSSLADASSAKYIRAYRRVYSNIGGSVNLYAARFYDSNKQLLPSLNCDRYLTSQSDRNPFSSGDAVALKYGGNVMKFAGLPTSSTGLATGRVWCDVNNGNVLKIVQ